MFCCLLAEAQTQIGNDIDGEAPGDLLGRSVSLSADGKRVAIGAPFNSANGLSAGQVKIYDEIGGIWTQVGNTIEGEASGDRSGWSVSLSADGKRVAIGAILNDGGDLNTGHVRIYEESGGTWKPVGDDIDGEAARDRSGYFVSLSSDGKRVAIGAIYNAGNGINSGQVRIYEEINYTWAQVGNDIDGEAAEDESGWSVSLSADGKRVAIGAIFNDGNGVSSGNTRIYSESNAVWTQVGMDIDGEALKDESGWSVSLSSNGRRVAIGARYNNNGNGLGAGHARVFEENGGSWTQIGLDIDGEEGSAAGVVSLSGNGKRIALGAPFNSESGSNAGKVRIYDDIGGTWTQIGSDLNGEAAEDRSGWALALSLDGRRLAVGAINNAGNGVNAGHVRIFGGALIPNENVLNEKNNIQIKPNPTSGKFTLKIDHNKASSIQIKIINFLGQTIVNESIGVKESGSIQQLDLSDYNNGIYFVQVLLDGEPTLKKLYKVE